MSSKSEGGESIFEVDDGVWIIAFVQYLFDGGEIVGGDCSEKAVSKKILLIKRRKEKGGERREEGGGRERREKRGGR